MTARERESVPDASPAGQSGKAIAEDGTRRTPAVSAPPAHAYRSASSKGPYGPAWSGSRADRRLVRADAWQRSAGARADSDAPGCPRLRHSLSGFARTHRVSGVEPLAG